MTRVKAASGAKRAADVSGGAPRRNGYCHAPSHTGTALFLCFPVQPPVPPQRTFLQENNTNVKYRISRKDFDHLLWYYFKGGSDNPRIVSAMHCVGKQDSRLVQI